MILEFFSTAKVTEFAKGLAHDVAKRYPPAIANNPAQMVSQKRLTSILEEAFVRAAEFKREHKLGWYKKAKLGKRCYPDRMAFGAWINDVRSQPLALDKWPPVVLDDTAEQSLVETMDLQAASGYNVFDVFGFFAAYGWPVDIVSAVDKDRDKRVRRILKAAHERGIKLIYGLGVYSWGFDEIIKSDAEVRGLAFTDFDASDVVRHPLVARIVAAYEKNGKKA